MDKPVVRQRNVEYTVHQFYCDDCGMYLGDSIEYEDGYFETLGDFEERFLFCGDWFHLKRHLCKECRIKLISKMKDSLIRIGFYKGEFND